MNNVVYGYRARNLKKLGFDNYDQYRCSPLWRTIRCEVLKRDGHKCRKCGTATADQVHHAAYTTAVLLGRDTDRLFSVCRSCHREIEFDGDVKRPGSEVMRFNGWIGAVPVPEKKPKDPSSKKQKKTAATHTGSKRKKKNRGWRGSPVTVKQVRQIRIISEMLDIPVDVKRLKKLNGDRFSKWLSELSQLQNTAKAEGKIALCTWETKVFSGPVLEIDRYYFQFTKEQQAAMSNKS